MGLSLWGSERAILLEASLTGFFAVNSDSDSLKDSCKVGLTQLLLI